MLQDPLSAIGARLEARLLAQDTRVKSVEQALKEKVSANPPPIFRMLPDGTRQFGYAPSAVELVEAPSEERGTPSQPEADYGIGLMFSSAVRDEIKAQFIANAPVLKSETDLTAPIAEPDAAVEAVDLAAAKPEQIAVSQTFPSADAPIAATQSAAVQSGAVANATAPTSSSASQPASPAAPLADAASPVAMAATSSNSGTASNGVAANVSANVSANATANAAGFVILPDGTKQFGYAPTGGSNIVGPHAQMPVVTPDFGPGATFRLKGIQAGPTMTVTRTGDRLIFANVTDAEGTREMAFVPAHLSLVTAATT